MAQYGPISVYSLGTVDLTGPGAPTFVSATQISNTIIRLVIALPTMDSGGGNLTGLVKLSVASLPMVGTTNPFTGKAMNEILVLPSVQKIDVTVSAADAGTQRSVDVSVMNLGGTQAFCAACSD